MTSGRSIVAGTTNVGKLRELRALLEPHGFVVIVPTDLGAALEVEETGNTFEENAVLKAEAYRDASGTMSLADDSGLSVDALDGAPGVYSARYGGPGLDDRARAALVIAKLRDVPAGRRMAGFVCCIAIATPGAPTRVFRGEVEGHIADEPRGAHGFGYDPIFVPTGSMLTYGERRSEDKAESSHRSRALRAAIDHLRPSFPQQPS